jgi:hypothetical protein
MKSNIKRRLAKVVNGLSVPQKSMNALVFISFDNSNA